MVLRSIAPAALATLLLAASVSAASPADEHSRFMAENDAAMTRMMDGMNIKPTGDVDRDFAAMMIPHHQGAIDMAVAFLRYGHNEQLRRIAQEIIVEQQQEIDAMRLATGLPPSPVAAAPTQTSGEAAKEAAKQAPKQAPAHDMNMHGAMHHGQNHDHLQKDH